MSDKAKPKVNEPAPVVPAAEEPAAPRKPSAIIHIVKGVAFVSILVIVQVVAASMLIPSAEDTEKLAKQYVAAEHGETAAGHEAESAHDGEHAGADTEEVELGTYNITHYNPASNATSASTSNSTARC